MRFESRLSDEQEYNPTIGMEVEKLIQQSKHENLNSLMYVCIFSTIIKTCTLLEYLLLMHCLSLIESLLSHV